MRKVITAVKSWKKDSVLVYSEERIQQRDQDVKKIKVFVTRKIHVEKTKSM